MIIVHPQLILSIADSSPFRRFYQVSCVLTFLTSLDFVSDSRLLETHSDSILHSTRRILARSSIFSAKANVN